MVFWGLKGVVGLGVWGFVGELCCLSGACGVFSLRLEA